MELRPYNVVEVSEILRVHPNTILALLKAGKLRGGKIGREWRVTPAALDEYLRGLGPGGQAASDTKED